MNGAKFFSTVDDKCGYWNVRLNEESSFLTRFNSPFGRYRFKRMPFGLQMSQDIFQACIDRLIKGLEGVIAIADNIVFFWCNSKRARPELPSTLSPLPKARTEAKPGQVSNQPAPSEVLWRDL